MKLVSLVLAGAAWATAAAAGDEVMAAYIGNTLTATAPNGVTKVYYNADHTWSAVSAQGNSRGTWSVKDGDELCVTQTHPAPPPGIATPPCLKLEPHKVGDSWSWTPPGARGPTTMTLTAGH